MALFAKKPRMPTPDDVVRLRSRRDTLAKQLENAEAAAQVKQRAVEQLLIDDGEPALLSKAENALAETERQARSLAGAIHTLGLEIEAKEAEVAAAADRRLRAETVAQLEVVADDVAEASAAFAEAARRFAEATGVVAGTIWEIGRMHNLATGLVSDVSTASAIAESLIRDHAKAVAAGTAPASLQQAEPAPAPVAAPQKPKRVIYTIKPIIWTDPESGFQLTKPAYTQAPLSLELAERAIAINAAWDVTDPRVAATSRSFPAKHVAPSQCVSLDHDGGNHQVEQSEPRIVDDPVIRHSAYERA